VDDGPCNRDLLPLARGEPADRRVGDLSHLELLEERRGARLDALRGEAVEPGEVADHLPGRQALVDARRPGEEADAPAHALRVLGHVRAVHADPAGGRPQDRRDHPERRRLPGAVRAEEAQHASRLGAERDAVHGADLTAGGILERLAEVLDDDQGGIPPGAVRSRTLSGAEGSSLKQSGRGPDHLEQ
jgi:hypothetical protein